MAIKLYQHTDPGAPSMTGQMGSLISLLDAVLVDGYNSVAVTSLTRVGATVTVTTSAPHGLQTGDSALISGAVEAGYNRDAVVTVTGLQTLTYAIPNEPSSPATGTITIKRAPAGFTKTYAGTNKACYRSNDLSGTRHTLRVDDNALGTAGSRQAFCHMYEAMTSLDVGSGKQPVVSPNTNGFGYGITKSSSQDATKRPWLLVTDGKIFYLWTEPAGPFDQPVGSAGSNYVYCFAFGDIISFRPGDIYRSIITGDTQQNYSYDSSGIMGRLSTPSASTTFTGSASISRDYTAIAGTCYIGSYTGAGSGALGSTNLLPFPHPVDNGLYVVPVLASQATPAVLRGRYPGLYDPLHFRPLPNHGIVSDVEGLPGRRLLMQYVHSATAAGCVFVDLTGPWE